MRIFRCKTTWILASLFLMILANGCILRGSSRKLSPAMEEKYQDDVQAYQEEKEKLRTKNTEAYRHWQNLIKNNAPRQEIDLAHLAYLSADEDYDNHYGQGPPSRHDVKYTEHYRPETGHKYAHRPVKTIPPVTSHPPKPPKPPCKSHHH